MCKADLKMREFRSLNCVALTSLVEYLAYSKTSAFLGTMVISHHTSIQNINFISVGLTIKMLICKLKLSRMNSRIVDCITLRIIRRIL